MEKLKVKQGMLKEKAITLIALIITIVVLLILAGITINLTIGEGGIITRAQEAGRNYVDAAENEKTQIAGFLNETDNIIANVTSGNGGSSVDDVPTVEIEDTHTVKTLTCSWEELEQIAEVISDNDETINNETLEVKVSVEGKEYTVGVGDLATVTYNGVAKTVRIMGFNHDTLTNTAAYGEGKENTYAGISFEFVNFIMSASMNSSDDNISGWGGCALRSTLNSDAELNKLGNISQIKQVNKTYLLGNESTTTQNSQDKLWLLSCSEIWSNGYNGTGTYGLAKAKEGEQYKYYKNINADYDSANTNLVKDSNAWWLRSPYLERGDRFCDIGSKGSCSREYAVKSEGMAPGFSI